MRNLLALVGAVVVIVAGLGYFLGWYKLGVESGSPGHPKFNVEVESDKIKQDLKKGREEVSEILHNGSSSVNKTVEGLPTSLPKLPDGIIPSPSTVLPPAPIPSAQPGTVVPIIPPPPPFPGNQ